jgi:poly-beta-1,6-N-acetyl-D-glucosamine biosynthesis protein PgaD
MSGRQQDDWPPIISAGRPTWAFWRDTVLTGLVWGLFFFVLEREMAFAGQALRVLGGHEVEPIDTGFDEFLARMGPTVAIIAILLALLVVATLASLRRREAALLGPQPVPVPDRDLARDLGADEQALSDIRAQKIVALDIDENGHVSPRPDWKPPTATSA